MKKITTILLIFLSFLFLKINTVNADLACNPYECAGTTTYLKIINCDSDATGTYCTNGDEERNALLTCSSGGTANGCSATAVGVDGCGGLSPVGTTSTCNTCVNDTDFNNDCIGASKWDSCGSGIYSSYCGSCTINPGTCPAPASSDRKCCNNVIDAPFCGDGTCDSGENNCNCGSDCSGVCNPPASCGDGTCDSGEDNCNCSADCSGTCDPSPSCDVTTSPSSVTVEIEGASTSVQANVTNILNGTVSDVGFSPSNGNISISPAFDPSSPYRTTITPEVIGTTTLATTVYMNGGVVSCSRNTTVTVNPCSDMETPNTVAGILAEGQVSGNIDISDNNISLTWNDPGIPGLTSDIDYYEIKIWDKAQGTAVPATCDASTSCVRHQTASKVESYSASANVIHGTDVYVAVRAVNDGCLAALIYGNWSSVSSYDLVSIVSGNFYDDPTATPDGFNNCSSGVTTPIDLTTYAGSDVTGSAGGYDGSPGTSYSITTPYAPSISWPDFGFSVTLDIDNSSDPENSITCACPGGFDPFTCQQTDTASPATEHFYISTVNLSNGPWWQAIGGNVYGTNSFVSAIPQTCADEDNILICKPDLITENADLDTNSAGIPMSGTIIDTGGFYTERGATDPRANDTDHDNIIRENYAYLSKEVDLGAAEAITGTITSLPTGATPDSDNTQVYFSNTDLIIDFSSTQNIPSGTKIVIFVDGNLTFSSTPDTSMITVDQGGFFGAIASGNITLDESIGNTSEIDISSNIEGVFVADGSINIDGYSDDALIDNKFVGEGTFVGWSTFSMSKDYDNTTNPLQKELNNLNPAEVFIFRPDLNLNIPEILKRPSMVWQEVN